MKWLEEIQELRQPFMGRPKHSPQRPAATEDWVALPRAPTQNLAQVICPCLSQFSLCLTTAAHEPEC